MRFPSCLLVFILIGIAFAGCLQSEPDLDVVMPSPEGPLFVQGDGFQLEVDKDETRGIADDARFLAIRYHFEERTTLASLTVMMAGMNDTVPPYNSEWFAIVDAQDTTHVAAFGILSAAVVGGDFALFPEQGGPELQVEGPLQEICDLQGGCPHAGFELTYGEDIVLDAGEWWFLLGSAARTVHDATIRLEVGTKIATPVEVHVGTDCGLLSPWNMGGDIRLYVSEVFAHYQGLHGSFLVRDNLFAFRVGLPTLAGEFEEEIFLPNETVYSARQDTLQEPMIEWPRFIMGGNMTGQVDYHLHRFTSTVFSWPPMMAHCTFADEGLLPFEHG